MATIDWAARIRTYLHKSDAKPDATAGEVLAAIGSAVQAAIENHCSRTFSNVTYTDETYDGNDRAVLYLRHAPIVSVASLSVSGSAVTPSIVAQGEAIRHPSRVWPCGSGNIVLTYTAGLESTETGQPPRTSSSPASCGPR